MDLSLARVTGVSKKLAKNGAPFLSVSLVHYYEGKLAPLTITVWSAPIHTSLKFGDGVSISKIKVSGEFLSCLYSDITIKEIPKDDVLAFESSVPTLAMWNEMKDFWDNSLVNLSSEWKGFISTSFDDLYKLYCKAPAAKSNHHAYPGGLLEHVYQMINMFRHIQPSLPFIVRPEVVVSACLYHDYGKISEYRNGEITREMPLMGHVYMSAYICQNQMNKYGIPYSEYNRVVHAILAHHGKLEWGSPVAPATTEAFLVHHLDMLSGHGVMFDQSCDMERNYSLGVTIVKYEDSGSSSSKS